MGKTGIPAPVKYLPDPIRTRGLITRPDPNPRVRVGSSKPAGTGVLALLTCQTVFYCVIQEKVQVRQA